MTSEVEPQARTTRPLLPMWLRSRDTLLEGVLWGARYYTHVAAFHTIRLPLYWLRLTALAPVGLWRIVRVVYRWAVDADGMAVRAAMKESDATPSEWIRLTEQRRQMVGG